MRAVLITSLLWSAAAAAADFRSMDVSHQGDRYQVKVEVRLAAPPEQVYQVLTDY